MNTQQGEDQTDVFPPNDVRLPEVRVSTNRPFTTEVVRHAAASCSQVLDVVERHGSCDMKVLNMALGSVAQQVTLLAFLGLVRLDGTWVEFVERGGE
jgi:hypothetical protein